MRYLSPKKRENEVISGARQAVRLTHKSSKTHLFSLFSRPFPLFCCHICAMGNAHTRPQKQGCRRTWSACAWTLTWVTSVTKKRPFCAHRGFFIRRVDILVRTNIHHAAVWLAARESERASTESGLPLLHARPKLHVRRGGKPTESKEAHISMHAASRPG